MPRSLAEHTREAAREHPFLVTALAAGVVNYAAAARFLDVEGDPEAVATALSRYADELDFGTERRRAPVSIRRGVGLGDRAGDRTDGTPGNGDADGGDATTGDGPLLAVGDLAVRADAGNHAALVATGTVDCATLSAVLSRLSVEGIEPVAASVGGETLLVVVDDGDGPDALRAVESALEAVPAVGG